MNNVLNELAQILHVGNDTLQKLINHYPQIRDQYVQYMMLESYDQMLLMEFGQIYSLKLKTIGYQTSVTLSTMSLLITKTSVYTEVFDLVDYVPKPLFIFE